METDWSHLNSKIRENLTEFGTTFKTNPYYAYCIKKIKKKPGSGILGTGHWPTHHCIETSIQIGQVCQRL